MTEEDSRRPPVRAERSPLLRSVRRWLLVLVVLVGVLVILFSSIGYTLGGEADAALFAATGLVGGVTALVAGLRVIGSVLRGATGTRPRGETDGPTE